MLAWVVFFNLRRPQTVKVKTETRVAYLKGNRQSCLFFIIPGTQTPESTSGRVFQV